MISFGADLEGFNGKKYNKFHASMVDNMAIKNKPCAVSLVQTNHVQMTTISNTNKSHGAAYKGTFSKLKSKT